MLSEVDNHGLEGRGFIIKLYPLLVWAG